MRWKGRRGSANIEDRRSKAGGKGVQLGGVGLLAVLAIGYFLGVDVSPLLEGGVSSGEQGAAVELTEADQQAGAFVSVTLADTEEVWSAIFREELGRSDTPATLVLFKGTTQSP